MELLLAPAMQLVMPGMVSGELCLGRALAKGPFSSLSPICAKALCFFYHWWGFLEVLLGGNISGGSRSFQAGLDGTVQKDRGTGLRFAAFGGVG